jgi:hypothetical protein
MQLVRTAIFTTVLQVASDPVPPTMVTASLSVINTTATTLSAIDITVAKVSLTATAMNCSLVTIPKKSDLEADFSLDPRRGENLLLGKRTMTM